MAAGRPTKLTDEVCDMICQCVSKGLPIKLSCHYAGIDYSTYNKWMHISEQDDAPQEYIDFFNRVKRKQAEFVLEMQEIVNQAARERTPFYATWTLEKQYGEFYNTKQFISAETKNENINENVDVKPTKEVEQEILSKLARISTNEGT
jgi:hypothetical protein